MKTPLSPCRSGFSSFVLSVPFVGLGAFQIENLVSSLHPELAFLEYPFAVRTHKGEVAAFQGERHGALLARLQLYLSERSETPVLRSERRNHVAAEEHHRLLACHCPGVGHVDRQSYVVTGCECVG